MQVLDEKIITTLRMLSVDAVEKAKSGHPGMPLGAAPLIYAIWNNFLNYNPKNPQWENRDRFVLSAGHGSALLYSMLHLSGYDLSLEDLKNFRQWGSKTPGHPEYGHTAGVEATTGPLGHGFAAGIGMALAEKMLAAQYNKPSYEIIDHYVYGIVSDGDLMEGVASEAASLAGTMGLGKVIYLYDDNNITIEGKTDLAFTEDVQKRFDAYGWQTIKVDNAEDIEKITSAIEQAKKEQNKPSLILVKTHIGFGSPKADSPSAHGEPLGKEAIEKTKEHYGVNGQEAFTVDDEVKEYFAAKSQELEKREEAWQDLFFAYKKKYPLLASELEDRWAGKFEVKKGYITDAFKDVIATSTREASGVVLQTLAELLPALCGGSADLATSNKTYINNAGSFSKENPAGRNIHFGVREQAMTGIVNGVALHGGFIPYGATFLVFADFMRPAIRLAALMGIHSIFILTHDSISVGEDGPTHQPIEQIMSLRIIPDLLVLRPADALETKAAWRIAINSKKPTALILTRQKLPVLHEYADQIASGVEKGGYVIKAEKGSALDIILLATGSEVTLALDAQKALLDENIQARVVSLPSWRLFDSQEKKYQQSVLMPKVPVVAIEAGTPIGWSRYTGCEDNVVGIDHFGASAPGSEVYDKFGFNVHNIVAKVKQVLGKK